MKKPELLAPAGNYQSLIYAVNAGCDAVYLGGQAFGARAFSNNFTNDELVDAIKYCHLRKVKVYVTANTLVHDNEVDKFLEFIDFIHKNNVDAVLIQDLGMFNLVHQIYPNLELHCSTQMHIHNLDGAKMMESLGAKRIVLARETTIENIKKIKESINSEIEVFVHGSLCISYSGECLLGYYLNNRSGNRGECSGECRQKYKVISNKKVIDECYPLSSKDLCTLEHIGDLMDINVDSLKIEGRMKSPEYVYTVVSLYREAIDSYYNNHKVLINQKKLMELKKIYNRDFTKGFIFHEDNNNFINKTRPNHQGIEIGTVINYKRPYATIKLTDDLMIGSGLRILSKNDVGVLVNEFYINNKLVKLAHKGDTISLKIKDDVEINSKVIITKDEIINTKLKEEIEINPKKIPVDIKVIAKLNKLLTISFNDITLTGSIITNAINRPTTKEDITLKISKLGNTVYKVNDLNIELDDNVFVNISELNDLRRQLVELLDEQSLYQTNYQKELFKGYELKNYSYDKIKCLLTSNKQIDQYLKIYNVIYSPNQMENTIYQYPVVVDTYEESNKHFLISEIGGLYKLSNVDTDSSLNVYNAYTVAFLHSRGVNKITLSRELTKDNIKDLINNYHKLFNKHPNVEVIINSPLMLMVCKFNLNKFYDNNDLILNDKLKITTKDDLMYLYSPPIINNENYYELGVNSLRENRLN